MNSSRDVQFALHDFQSINFFIVQCVHQQEYEPIARNMEDSQNSLMRSLAEYESKKFSEKADLASIHFSNKSSQYRKTFYVFLRLVKSYEEDVKKYGGYFQKCLNIKTRMVLEPREISDLFERRLFKFGKNQNRIPKFWSDDETLLLLTFIACFCAIYLEDFLNLVLIYSLQHHNNNINSLSQKDHVWRSLATIYPGRDADELKWKWDSIIRIPLHKVPWSTSEDQLLRDLIPIVGPIKWHQIALELCFKSEGKFVRNSNDCWNRWTNYLDPSSSKKIWTNQEEMTMLKALLEGERNWAEIAKRLQGKTEKRTRNRWIRLLKKYRTEIEAEARKLEIFVTRGEVWEQYLIKKLIEIKQNSVSESTLEGIPIIFLVV